MKYIATHRKENNVTIMKIGICLLHFLLNLMQTSIQMYITYMYSVYKCISVGKASVQSISIQTRSIL